MARRPTARARPDSAAPVKRPAAPSKEASGDQTSDDEALVLPTEAYDRLLSTLGVSSTAVSNAARAVGRSGQEPGALQSIAGRAARKRRSFEKAQMPTDRARLPTVHNESAGKACTASKGEKLLKQRQLKRSRGDGLLDLNPNVTSTTIAHLERQVTEADILALRSQALAVDSSRDFAAAWPEASWLSSAAPLPEVPASLASHGVRTRLIDLWREAHPSLPEGSDFVSKQQAAFFAALRSYKDVLYPCHPYPQSVDADDGLLDAALLHAIDHVAACSQRIRKANEVLKARPDAEVPRDQGFSRAKVLLLLPTRNFAYQAVERLLRLAQRETRSDSVQGRQRFVDEFGGGGEAGADAPGKAGSPAEHAALFAGDTDDHFRFGIKLTKGAVKLYANFYQADVVVASPLGLITKSAETGAGDAPVGLDFLSSVEIVIAPRCDVLQMQNWAHVVSVFEALNVVPGESRGADVMRVYDWCLAGHARSYRQNVLLSSFASPELNSLFSRLCASHQGKARLNVVHAGVLGGSSLQLRQMFERFSAESPAADAEARFERFKERMWPRIRDSGSGGQLVFAPSYFDFVRLRAFLADEGAEFEGLSEYASGPEVARGRSRFAAGRVRLALYTERAHFYHRRRTKGVKDIYFYQLPEHPQFYAELLALAAGAEAGHSTATALFSRFDALRLERIVGAKRARSMLKAASATFLFY